jgi:hypothetical protein
MDFTKLEYRVHGQIGQNYESALRCWKTQHKTFDVFLREVITHDSMKAFADHVQPIWDEIKPLTITEAFAEKNIELRRLMFSCIGIQEMFKQLEPELIDRQEIDFKNKRWDKDNQPYFENIKDVYELYNIKGEKLFPEEKDWRKQNFDTYADRCWCTTTGREYWIYVPRWEGEKNDAVSAIAWTMQITISNPEYIVRQGDVIIAKASEDSVEYKNPQHLTKKQYLTLLQSQT